VRCATLARVTKRIVVHTGPGKTGSSALQQWLTTHRQGLLDAGVLYPAHGLDRNGVSSGNREELLDMVDVDGHHRHVVSALKAEALRAALADSPCHTLLLSSEFFFPALLDIQKELPEAEFVVYVRNPIELLESNYNQSVKRHDETRAFTPPERFQAGLFGQIRRLLGAKTAPRLILRPYGEALFEGGDIVSDLLRVLDVAGEKPTGRRVNASYTLDALEFKRHANHFALGPLQPTIDRTLQAYAVGPREYSLVPPETYATMRAACLEQLDQLMAERHVPELGRLRDDLHHAAQRTYLPQSIERERLLAVADHLEAVEPETFMHLRARVQRMPGLPLPNAAFYDRFAPA